MKVQTGERKKISRKIGEHHILNGDDIQLLADIGFTTTQAKIYLTLLKTGQTEGHTLSKNAEVPRQVVYRTLDELQHMGLIQKSITRPYKFTATPLKYGLQIIISQKRQQYKETKIKAKNILQKMQNYNEEITNNHEYSFNIIEGRERIAQILKLQYKKTKIKVDTLSTLPRWLQIVDCCNSELRGALAKKVKIRVVVKKPEYEISLPENVSTLLEKPNFKLKISPTCLQTNLSVFDNEEAYLSFFPSKPLGSSPLLLTNHPSFIAMARDHFESFWKPATEWKLEKK